MSSDADSDKNDWLYTTESQQIRRDKRAKRAQNEAYVVASERVWGNPYLDDATKQQISNSYYMGQAPNIDEDRASKVGLFFDQYAKVTGGSTNSLLSQASLTASKSKFGGR